MKGINRRQALGVLGVTAVGAMASVPSLASAATIAQAGLNWPAPALDNPETITVGTTFDSQPPDLDVNKDYIIKLPSTTRNAALIIKGGNNVVIIGGHIRLPVNDGVSAHSRAIHITGNQGVVHIEGVLIDTVAGGLGDGVTIQASNAIVQVQKCRIMNIRGIQSGFHGDVIQPWGGVRELRVDQLTASSSYQGLFCPVSDGPIGRIIVKRTNITALPEEVPGANGGFMWWVGTQPSVTFSDFYVQPRSGRTLGQSVWPADDDATNPCTVANNLAVWPTMANISGGIRGGQPPGGDFCPNGVPGLGYTP